MREHQHVLVELLQARFGEVPVEVRRRFEHTDDNDQLKVWVMAIVRASRLADVGIPPFPEDKPR